MDSTTRASTIAASNGGSWDIGDPEEILRRLHRQHPNADRAELRGIFLDHLSAMVAHEIIRPLGAVFFDARYTYVVRPAPAIVSSQTLHDKAREEVAGAMRDLMSLRMPNGKRLGDCTRSDLLRLGAQCKRIAERVPRGKKRVRDVMDEGDLQKLWNRRA